MKNDFNFVHNFKSQKVYLALKLPNGDCFVFIITFNCITVTSIDGFN